ncbi:MAG: DUF2007 domain-containing protein [bacterium]|nr:DUF2007 domain-containing protein [bacterium]
MKSCINHPDKKTFSICHGCGKDYCEECLDEGKEYYYCKNPECQNLLRGELPPTLLAIKIICPNCSSELELEDEERTSRKVHCPECEAFINLKAIPPKVFKKENYVELFSSLNQGDIALIQSILDDSEIDYYVLGENFLSARPLLEPARFFVNENQFEEANEVLKELKLNIWGTSKNQNE